MQIIASNRWILQLGDIKGAFLESGPIAEKFHPLFAKQPMGGVPGLPSDAVIEVTGNVYVQNDAPVMWYRTFDQEVISLGWSRSKIRLLPLLLAFKHRRAHRHYGCACGRHSHCRLWYSF